MNITLPSQRLFPSLPFAVHTPLCAQLCMQLTGLHAPRATPLWTCSEDAEAAVAAARAAAAGAAGAAGEAGSASSSAHASARRLGASLVSPKEAAAKLKGLLPGRSKSERAELLEREAAAASGSSSARGAGPAGGSGGAQAGGPNYWAAAGKVAPYSRSASEIKSAYGRGSTASGRWVCQRSGLGAGRGLHHVRLSARQPGRPPTCMPTRPPPACIPACPPLHLPASPPIRQPACLPCSPSAAGALAGTATHATDAH